MGVLPACSSCLEPFLFCVQNKSIKFTACMQMVRITGLMLVPAIYAVHIAAFDARNILRPINMLRMAVRRASVRFLRFGWSTECSVLPARCWLVGLVVSIEILLVTIMLTRYLLSSVFGTYCAFGVANHAVFSWRQQLCRSSAWDARFCGSLCTAALTRDG
jgi:hypothetical protein